MYFVHVMLCLFIYLLFKGLLANIVPRSRISKCFDPLRNLTRSDVVINQHGLIVTFKCTKTIQFGERKLHYSFVTTAWFSPMSSLCVLTYGLSRSH